MKDLNNNRIEELLPRYCEGRLSEGERLEVEAWMDESEENKRVATQTFALYMSLPSSSSTEMMPVSTKSVHGVKSVINLGLVWMYSLKNTAFINSLFYRIG